jgi:hypothetical protein
MTDLPFAHAGTCFTGRFALYWELGRAMEKYSRKVLAEAHIVWYEEWEPEYPVLYHTIRSVASTGDLSDPDAEVLGNISLILAGVSAQAIAAKRDNLLELEHPDVDYALELANGICESNDGARALVAELAAQKLEWMRSEWHTVQQVAKQIQRAGSRSDEEIETIIRLAHRCPRP